MHQAWMQGPADRVTICEGCIVSSIVSKLSIIFMVIQQTGKRMRCDYLVDGTEC